MNLSVDPSSKSADNRFSSVRLDRLAERRDDPEWVSAALTSERARVVPLWHSRSLIEPGADGARALYLPLDQIEADDNDPPPTLLGGDDRHVYFTASIGDIQREAIVQRHPHAEFRDLRLASLDMAAKHAGILAYAKALHYWQYRHRFCGICGTPNLLRSSGHRMRCGNPECNRESFPRIDPAIIVLITHQDACLLGRNSAWPKRRFSTLAGFVEPGESLEDAVAREVWEEARVRLVDVRYRSSQPWPFPASAMCGFYAEAASRDATPADEIEELRWFTAPELTESVRSGETILSPPVSIAFRLQADWFRAQGGGDLEALTQGQAAFR